MGHDGKNWGRIEGLGLKLPFVRPEEGTRRKPMSYLRFRNANLNVMDEKDSHWSLPAYAGMVRKGDMVHQFRSQYGVFVKNFPDYLEGALKQCSVPEIRAELEENIAEERYGAGARKILENLKERGVISYVPEDTAHPELFKLIPKGLGFDTSDFDDFDAAPLLPKAEAFRKFLFRATHESGLPVALAVGTIFLEGKHDWEVFADKKDLPKKFKNRNLHTRAKTPAEHALHVYGAESDDLMLTWVHHEFEGANGTHRKAAWDMVLNYTPEIEREKVILFMREALLHHNEWRDEIAEQCGLVNDGKGNPMLRNASGDRGV